MTALAEIGALQRTALDDVLARVSTHDELAQALAACAAVMESIVEDAEVRASCYRDIEAAVGPDVLLWSSTEVLSASPHCPARFSRHSSI